VREVTLTPADAGRRLDKYLAQYLNNAPRSLIYKYLRTRYIKLNGKKADGHELTSAGDRISLYLPIETLDGFMAKRAEPAVSLLPDIIYEDEWLLMLNKPAGLLSQPDVHGGPDNLVDRAWYYLRQKGVMDISADATFTPALCNRLDRNTSGLVACGKTLAAVQRLNALFAGRGVHKEYLAVVHGVICGSGVLEGYLYKDEKRNIVRVTRDKISGGKQGLAIKTTYKVIAATAKYSLLRCFPVTGRSHQIRAQMAALGHPLAGDVKYGGIRTPYAPAQLLHCRRMTFIKAEGLPYPENSAWEAPPPQGFLNCLKDWFDYESIDFCRGLRDADVPPYA
jgi:23S rRNA pseudouridine955/2504/2580 synthase